VIDKSAVFAFKRPAAAPYKVLDQKYLKTKVVGEEKKSNLATLFS
jgi:hypothetical protein